MCSVGDRQERGEHILGAWEQTVARENIALVCTFGRLCALSTVYGTDTCPKGFLSKQLAAGLICLRGGGGVNRLLCSNFINFRTSVLRLRCLSINGLPGRPRM